MSYAYAQQNNDGRIPAFAVALTTALTINAGATVRIPFNSIISDRQNGWQTVPGKYVNTLPFAGLWHITAQIRWNTGPAAASTFEMVLGVSGNTNVQRSFAFPATTAVSGSIDGVFAMLPGDFTNLDVVNSSGTNVALTTDANGIFHRLAGYFLGPL